MAHSITTTRSPKLIRPAAVVSCVLALVALGACSSDDDGASTDANAGATAQDEQSNPDDAPDGDRAEEMYPDVEDVELKSLDDGRYEVSTTLSSPYDSPERYADAWRVLDPDGNELGVRELTHDHADEQPFTRSTEVEIPDDVAEVTVEGRDQVSGWGGETVTVSVPREGG